jgi:hypothetical protein
VETSFTEGMLTTVEKPATAGANTLAETPGSLETPVAERTSTAEGRRQQQRIQPKQVLLGRKQQ